jgi:ferredoxin
MKLATQVAVREKGLAPASLKEIDVMGEIPFLPRFRLPSSLMRLDPWGLGHRIVSQRLARPQIKVNKAKCLACGACAESCPVNAIEVTDFPSFDYNQCISCYCCYEVCPENALEVGGLMRLIRRR